MKTRPFRLAAIDLDDTLLGPDKQISPANAAAVCELRARGIRVILASGRKHENMTRFYYDLGLDGWVVSSQGALVRHGTSDAVLHHRPIPADVAARLTADATAAGATLIYYHDDAIYVARRNRHTDLYQSRGRDALVEIGDWARLAGECPLKVIWMDDPEATAARFPVARERYRGLLDAVITSPEYLELMAAGTSKATGLDVVAREYGVSPPETLAFGDADNDVAMLGWVGWGVAMNVASPEAKRAAAMIAPPGDPAESFARAVAELIRRGMV
jgi:hypothetical protein